MGAVLRRGLTADVSSFTNRSNTSDPGNGFRFRPTQFGAHQAAGLPGQADGDFTAVDLIPADFARMADLVVTYGDLPLGTTDAAVVAPA
jgi:hypothetical protein